MFNFKKKYTHKYDDKRNLLDVGINKNNQLVLLYKTNEETEGIVEKREISNFKLLKNYKTENSISRIHPENIEYALLNNNSEFFGMVNSNSNYSIYEIKEEQLKGQRTVDTDDILYIEGMYILNNFVYSIDSIGYYTAVITETDDIVLFSRDSKMDWIINDDDFEKYSVYLSDNYLITGGTNGELQIRNLYEDDFFQPNQDPFKKIKVTDSQINNIKMTEDEKYIIIYTENKEIKIIELETDKVVFEITLEKEPENISISNDNKYLVCKYLSDDLDIFVNE
jgi:hypothetical protein